MTASLTGRAETLAKIPLLAGATIRCIDIAQNVGIHAPARAGSRRYRSQTGTSSPRRARAFRIGDLLIEAKQRGKESGEIPHGEFGKWCAQKITTVKHAQVGKFMKLARDIPKIHRGGNLADESIRSVYSTLAGPGGVWLFSRGRRGAALCLAGRAPPDRRAQIELWATQGAHVGLALRFLGGKWIAHAELVDATGAFTTLDVIEQSGDAPSVN